MSEAELKIAKECPLCETAPEYPLSEKSLERHKEGWHYVKGVYLLPGPRYPRYKEHLKVMEKLEKLKN